LKRLVVLIRQLELRYGLFYDTATDFTGLFGWNWNMRRYDRREESRS
jgi:hypothetical protein